MPAGSVTKPVMVPDSLSGVAAGASPAVPRHTAPASTSEATVLCVRAASIKRRSLRRVSHRHSLGYRKLGRRGKYLFTEFVGNFHSQRVLPRQKVFQGQKFFNCYLVGRCARNLGHFLADLENLLVGAVLGHLEG